MHFIAVLFTIIISFLFSAKPSQADNGFGGFEVYRNATAFYCGKNFGESDNWKIDLWVVENVELALTIGPKIGKYALGFGASLGDNNQITHLDADLTFKLLNNDRFKWSTYSLCRFGRIESSESKLVSRHRITPKSAGKDANFGLIGDNYWIVGNDPVFLWGPYYDFGQMGVFNKTMLHAEFNIEDGTKNIFVMLEF